MVITSRISVKYLRKYGFANSSDNLYAPCTYKSCILLLHKLNAMIIVVIDTQIFVPTSAEFYVHIFAITVLDNSISVHMLNLICGKHALSRRQVLP
jgi:hypothetical protein